MAERKRVYRKVEVKYVRLYLEDLEEIERFMTPLVSDSQLSRLEVSGPTFNGDSVADLIAHETVVRTNDFKMDCGFGGLDLRSHGKLPAFLTCFNLSDTKIRGAFEAVHEILKTRRLPLGIRLARWFVRHLAPLLGSTIGMYLLLASFISPGWLYTAWGLPLLLAAAVLVTAGLFEMHRPGEALIVYFARRNEAPNFWKRNRDQLVVAVVASAVTAVVTVLVTLLVTRG